MKFVRNNIMHISLGAPKVTKTETQKLGR